MTCDTSVPYLQCTNSTLLAVLQAGDVSMYIEKSPDKPAGGCLRSEPVIIELCENDCRACASSACVPYGRAMLPARQTPPPFQSHSGHGVNPLYHNVGKLDCKEYGYT